MTGVDVLSEEQLRHFRQLLLERAEVLHALDETGEAAAETVELDQTRVGRVSRMDALRSQAMSKESNRRRGEEFKRIDAALRRVEEGEYGWCLECGEVIAPARLEVDPAAPLCIQCASRAEG